MYPHVAHVFIDGGYLRPLARVYPGKLVHPRNLALVLMNSDEVTTWAYDPAQRVNAVLGRIHSYDAIPEDSERRDEIDSYWRAIELLEDVHLGLGALRGLKRNMRQKGGDTLLTVDLLVGAFSGLFDIAIIVAGDADFVPAVEEVKRRGVMVAVAASSESVSDDLRRAADRFIEIRQNERWLSPMTSADKTWPA